MISLEKFTAMLALQDQLNTKINPDWRAAEYPWHRAIMVEGVELLEHIGWKWWKKQTPDVAQAKIELVDIWHFALSMMLSDKLSPRTQYDHLLMVSKADMSLTLHEKIDALVEVAATEHFSAGTFMGLMHDLGMTWDELYATYVAKNVLNVFRQDHGYKEGTYIKTWGVGKEEEDNVVLERLMTLRPDATPEMLTEQLGKIYALVQAEAAK